jgi:hypothetical protein
VDGTSDVDSTNTWHLIMVPILSGIQWCENVSLDLLIIAHLGKIIVYELSPNMYHLFRLVTVTGMDAVKRKSDLNSLHFRLLSSCFIQKKVLSFLNMREKYNVNYY